MPTKIFSKLIAKTLRGISVLNHFNNGGVLVYTIEKNGKVKQDNLTADDVIRYLANVISNMEHAGTIK